MLQIYHFFFIFMPIDEKIIYFCNRPQMSKPAV